MKKYQFAAGFIAVLLASAAWASPQASGQSFWDRMDTDKDGFITREEASTMDGLTHLFDKIDSSKDGKLDKAEMEAIHGGAHGDGHGNTDAAHGADLHGT